MLLYMGSAEALAAAIRSRRIREIAACGRSCDAVIRTGLERLGHPEAGADASKWPRVIALAHDCRDVCDWAVSLASRPSPVVPIALDLCARTCRVCAEGCSEVSEPERILQSCSRICLSAAGACESLSGVAISS